MRQENNKKQETRNSNGQELRGKTRVKDDDEKERENSGVGFIYLGWRPGAVGEQ